MKKLVFATKAEAIDFLKSFDTMFEHDKGFSPKGTYFLANGEYSIPDFKPTRYKDGWGN